MPVVPLHLRGGTVLPLQAPALNTALSRQNNFTLLVALDANSTASGDIFLDDGDSLDTVGRGEFLLGSVRVAAGLVTMTVRKDGAGETRPIETVSILGLAGSVSSVTVNGLPYRDWQYSNGGLDIDKGLYIDICSQQDLTYNRFFG